MMCGMELYDVMRTTGAVRQFTGEPLPDEVLERILDNARFAPSGGNRQGVRVIAVRDMRDSRATLAELTAPGAQSATSAQIANGEAPWNPLAARAVSTTRRSTPTDGAQRRRRHAARTPRWCWSFCLDLGVVAAFDQDLDRIGVISGASVYPFVWNVLLAARNEGFGGVLTTMVVARGSRR